MNELLERISAIGIVPVVKITKSEDAIPLANALYQAGIDCAEITFRSEFAIQAIVDIKKTFPTMLLGAGTVLNSKQAQVAIASGADFIVTPGFNCEVVDWCIAHDVCILPGVSSATEIEMALAKGLTTLKFFPAESSGGAKKLKDLSGPYANVKFMPTGGIGLHNLHEYLALENVIAIGGSFMLDTTLIQQEDWKAIEKLSKEAIDHMIGYELLHLGIYEDGNEKAEKTARLLCDLFGFSYYQKPKSCFAGKGFEILAKKGRGEHGHFGLLTPYPERALYQLQKKGILAVNDSITRNKITNRINFVFLDIEISGFGIHLINPDVKM